ncbi:MAG: triphosphoribosyl-dephospho-CoA synthase [Candidatus Hermodarchaeota archaeon]
MKQIKIKSINNLMACINLASLLELAGWPKPGNVHRTRDYTTTRYEHFLSGIAAIQPIFRRFCVRVFNQVTDENQDYSFVKLGKFFKRAANVMMKWQKGGNVLLGHILILAPLSGAACICKKIKRFTLDDYKRIIEKIINDSTVQDTIDLYKAIKICNPGGLGKIEKYDLNDDNSIIEIERDKINLKKIFEFSKSYDLISFEYATGFEITLKEGLTYFFKTFKKYRDINIATVNTFLKLLGEHPDTLIVRKSGKAAALIVSKKAYRALEKGGVATRKGLKLVLKLDKKLHKKEGKMNPGTTADLIAGIIFCSLIFGLKF